MGYKQAVCPDLTIRVFPWLKVHLRQIVVVAMEWIEHESKLGTL